MPERFRRVHPGHRGGYFEDPRTRPMGADLDLFGRRRDGSEFPAEISLSSIETAEGPLAIAAVRDISEREQAKRYSWGRSGYVPPDFTAIPTFPET